MSALPPLISDLALILICAGVMTLIFKRLKQPLVLGYIVAGFLASPHFEYLPIRRQRPPLKFEKGNFSVNSEKWLIPRRSPKIASAKRKKSYYF